MSAAELEVRGRNSNVASVEGKAVEEDAASGGLDRESKERRVEGGGVAMSRDVESGVSFEVAKVNGEDVGRGRKRLVDGRVGDERGSSEVLISKERQVENR